MEITIKIKIVLRNIVYRFLRIAAFIWRKLLIRTTFIAITGSVGKTTTKECLASVLSAHYPTAKTKNNRNDLWGVPITILRIKPWHRYAVVEVGTEKPGMMEKLAKLVKPDITIVLKIARLHLMSFKTIDEYAIEKSYLLKYTSSKGYAIINADDPIIYGLKDKCSCKIKTFGITSGLDLWADNISSVFPESLSLTINDGKKKINVKTKLIGEHWINSILSSLLTASLCGINLNDAVVQIEKVKPFMGRMQPVRLPSGAAVIRDEFSGSFTTLDESLKVLKNAKVNRRVLVISNISDSSDNSRKRYKKIGILAAQVSDIAVFIGSSARHAVKTAVEEGMQKESVFNFLDLPSAAKFISKEFGKDDVILLKGRSTDHLSRILFAQFGNIGCWKAVCTKTIACDLCKDLKPEFNLHKTLLSAANSF